MVEETEEQNYYTRSTPGMFPNATERSSPPFDPYLFIANFTATFPCSIPSNSDLTPAQVVIMTYILPALVVFSGLGNISSAIILTTGRMRTPINFFLVALAVVDTLTLINAFLVYSVEVMVDAYRIEWLFQLWTRYLAVAYGCSHLWVTFATYLTVASTAMNFYVTVRRCEVSMKQVFSAMTCALFASCLVIFPKFLELEFKVYPACDRVLLKYELVMSSFMQKWSYQIIYSVYVNNLLTLWLPFILIILINLILLLRHVGRKKVVVRTPHKHDTKASVYWRKRDILRRHLSAKIKESQAILALVVVMFLVCSIPSGLLQVFELFDVVFIKNPLVYRGLRDAVNILTILQASVNFLIYPIISRRYRRTMMGIVRRACKRPGWSSTGASMMSDASAVSSLEDVNSLGKPSSCRLVQVKCERSPSVITHYV